MIDYLIFFALGLFTFSLSTLTAGGGAMMQIPIVTFIIGAEGTAPAINLGALVGRPTRLILFWKSIDWSVTKFYVLAAIPATLFAGYFFKAAEIGFLKIIIGLFLISTVFQFRFGKKSRSFAVQKWYFIPLGVGVPFISTLVGGMGPILNPFYLNYGLEKEALIATKTANSFLVGLIQIGSYSFFGLLQEDLWFYGLSLGGGAAVGNYIGKKLLARMKNSAFRIWVVVFMVISGLLMIGESLWQ